MTTIRPATMADLTDLLRMWKLCYPTFKPPAELPLDMPHMLTLMERWLAHNPDEVGVYVAEADGKVIGAATVCSSPMWFNTSPAAIGTWVWVDKVHRSRGVGRELVSTCEQWARDHGLGAIFWSSPVGSRAGHKLMERSGYRALETNYTKSL